MPFPDPPYRHAPLAIVKTRGGVVARVQDRRIRDANRASVYRNDADPPNMLRATSGYVEFSDGHIRWFDAGSWNGLDGTARDQGDFSGYGIDPSIEVVVDGERRVLVESYLFPHDPELPSERDDDGFAWWYVTTAPAGIAVLAMPDWPDAGRVAGRAATFLLHADVRMNAAGTDLDYTVGAVLSVTDARPSFGV